MTNGDTDSKWCTNQGIIMGLLKFDYTVTVLATLMAGHTQCQKELIRWEGNYKYTSNKFLFDNHKYTWWHQHSPLGCWEASLESFQSNQFIWHDKQSHWERERE